jgi:hypothetical protein
MRTINRTPMLRFGDRGPAVIDIQHLLNQSMFGSLDSDGSQAKPLVEDGIFGSLTLARVRSFQRSAGLSPDGIVGPKTAAALFAPQADQVDQAQQTAGNWTLIAQGAIQSLRAWVQTLILDDSPTCTVPTQFLDALAVHFHIRLPGATNSEPVSPLDLLSADESLLFIQGVFDDVSFVLDQASIRDGRVFYSVGPKQCEQLKIGQISAGNRLVASSEGAVRLICFPPSFAVSTSTAFFRTVQQRASTVLHECCHYVRPPQEGSRYVEDYAYGLPAFDGQASPRHPDRNYTQLQPNESLHNAESYNLFAEHVTFGRDTRFGRLKDDLASFQCGSACGC